MTSMVAMERAWSPAEKHAMHILERSYGNISFWGEEITSSKQPSSDDVS